MKYLFIEIEAVKIIVSHNKLQSVEFEEAKSIVNFLQTGNFDKDYYLGLFFKKTEEGFFIQSVTPDHKKAIVFDFTTFKSFSEKKEDDIITVFQKVLKFGIKAWNNMSLGPNELYATQKDHALGIVFPFPWTSKDSYRIILERNPLGKRAEKRDHNYLLVVADATQEIQLQPNYTLFRKIIDEAAKVCIPGVSKSDSGQAFALKAIDLHETDGTKNNLNIYGLSDWNYHLTTTQKNFVFKALTDRPERIEGAAGTGKTISMILRCINLLESKLTSQENFNILFITHSISSKNLIKDLLENNYPGVGKYYDRNYSPVSINVETLHEWCINNLNLPLSYTELLDRDAQDSKHLQLMHLEEALSEAMANDFASFSPILSETFKAFISSTKKEELLEMLQYEISITIKGRASDNLDKYKKLNRLKYSIPVESEHDLVFLYVIFKKYQNKLSNVGVFDTDDIILTSLNQLDTPIWRRRKASAGYNALFIDETHLFNLNELSVFHHLCKDENQLNIIYAIDKSQAIGDRGLTNEVINESLGFPALENISSEMYQTVFRCSPDIVNLAFSVLSSGATLFTSFENPLNKVQYAFTHGEERKSKSPKFQLYESDESMISDSFAIAERLCNELDTLKSKVLIISTSNELATKIHGYAKKMNKPFEVLKSRGDIEVLKTAIKTNRFVLSHIDYVGGLEFDAVVICGADKKRVPPTDENENESFHFLNYAWHNRMYVAITRAKYSVYLQGERARGISKLLEKAIHSKILMAEA